VHKHPYPRLLNLKAVLPQLQTLPILLAVGVLVVFATPQGSAKAPHPAYLRAQSAGRLQLEDSHFASTIEMRSAPSAPSDFISIGFSDLFPCRTHPTNAAMPSMIAQPARTRSRRPGRERRVKHRAGIQKTHATPRTQRPSDSVMETASFAHVRGRHRSGSGLPRYYAINAVAEALDVSGRTVRRWITNGDLIATRVRGVVRISDDDLRAFLALHREA
jgi:excisionase family DNA binding protein